MNNYLPPYNGQYTELIKQLYNTECKTITFQVTEDCCLNCSYCYQKHKTNKKMSFETAKIFMDKLLNNEYDFCTINNAKTVVFEFIGGEPLMEIELIDKICSYFITTMINLHHPWLLLFRCNICSNGVLYFSTSVQNFFKKYNRFCNFTISIDGNKQLHDACRKDFNGNGSYDKAIAAMKDYLKKYHIQMATKMTLAPENLIYLYDAVINLINEGYTEIHLNYVYENVWNQKHALILYNEMKKISLYLIDNELYNKIYISLYNEGYFKPIPTNENNNFCGGTGENSIAIDPNGDIYPCIRYMESSLNGKQTPLKLGNITNFLPSKKEKKIYNELKNLTRRSQSTNKCFYCPIGFGCGWCSALNYEEFGTPNRRATYICDMHHARALANIFYYNSLYKKLKLSKIFKINIPKTKILSIISEDEYNLLLTLTERS